VEIAVEKNNSNASTNILATANQRHMLVIYISQ